MVVVVVVVGSGFAPHSIVVGGMAVLIDVLTEKVDDATDVAEEEEEEAEEAVVMV